MISRRKLVRESIGQQFVKHDLRLFFCLGLLAIFATPAQWSGEALSVRPLSTPSIREDVGSVAVILPNRPSENTPEGDFAAHDENYSWWYDECIVDLHQLGTKLGIPILESGNEMPSGQEYRHLLTAVPCDRTSSYAFAIREVDAATSKKRSRGTRNKKSKNESLFIDLCPPSDSRMGHRLNKNGGELLLKALGLGKLMGERKVDEPVVIYDLTAGFARDSLVILSSQQHQQRTSSSVPLFVHMVERDPIVAELVSDAMRRLQLLASGSSSESSVASDVAASLSFESGDAACVLERLTRQMHDRSEKNKVLPLTESSEETFAAPWPPDICYLDPMFPPRAKSAAVKKDMAMLHSLLGTASNHEIQSKLERTGDGGTSVPSRIQDERVLLDAACKASAKRVVVKRPINAPPLGFLDDDMVSSGKNVADIQKPSYDVRGSVNRWDVYVIN